MARVKIINYSAGWNLKLNTGVLKLQAENQPWSEFIQIKNPAEFSAVVDLLRNEAPVYLDTKYGVINTASEPIGEGE